MRQDSQENIDNTGCKLGVKSIRNFTACYDRINRWKLPPFVDLVQMQFVSYTRSDHEKYNV